MTDNILSAKNLAIAYNGGQTPVFEGLSFDIAFGETLGICGKSGCGKSSIALAITKMLSYSGGIATGEIQYDGRNLLSISEREMQMIRWREIAMVPQSSMNALNPIYRIQKTLEETIKAHSDEKFSRVDLQTRCRELMEMVALGERELHSYPHELSGGMRQRVSIALALALSPKLLILDEATTGLDVLVEADILHTIRKIKRAMNISLIFITHDLRLQQAFCDRRLEL